MPMSSEQERWDVYVVNGTKATVRPWLRPDESLSEFIRAAIDRELLARQEEEAA
jgi:hypothetical protein